MSKKSLYILIGSVLLLIVVVLVLSKKGIIGNKDQGIAVEIAKVDQMTIVETVSTPGKSNPK
jgi:HlyD family secretion protein